MFIVKEGMLHHDPCGLAYLVIIGSICLYIPWMQYQEIDFRQKTLRDHFFKLLLSLFPSLSSHHVSLCLATVDFSACYCQSDAFITTMC